tara:strand:+ start:1747 stop:2256 length:510 start_codon:yes stop_codon:yes gene_type:complete
MFINPRHAIEEGWLRNVNESDIQPNAIDIPVKEIYKVDESVFSINKSGKTHRTRNKVSARENSWIIDKGVYDWVSDVYIEVPEGYVGWLHTRSTLNRNGLIVHSGLYDSGFKGHVCGMLYNLSGTADIEPNTCFAQFIIAPSDSEGVYEGGYNVEEGSKPWFDSSINQV